MLKGTCPKCGKVYYGWALLVPEIQYCDCGAKLTMSEDVYEGMKATKGNMKDYILDKHAPRRILYCPNCGMEYSGNAGDYWNYPGYHLFHCHKCGEGMELVEKIVKVDYVQPRTTEPQARDG